MENKGIAIAGALLLVIGIVGLAATLLLSGTAFISGPLLRSETGFDSLGESIYLTGVGENGAIHRSGGIGRMGSGGCITCHGPDGEGGSVGMMGTFEDAPPIAYEVLTGTHEEHDGDDESAEEWTDASIAQAIRDGITPTGERLDPIMPRWDMNDEDMDALIDYLKTLGEE